MATAKQQKSLSGRGGLVSGLRIRQESLSRFKDIIDKVEPRSLANALFQRPLEMVFICDMDGIFVHANNKTLRRLGYASVEEMRSLNMQSLLALESFETYMSMQERLKEMGDIEDPCKLVMRTKSGKKLPVFARPTVLTNGTGPEAVLWHASSVEQLERAAMELRELKEFAEISASAAHDLKSLTLAPRAVLDELCAAIGQDDFEPSKLRKLADRTKIALGSIEKMVRLLEELRFARPKKEKPQRIVVNSLLADVVLQMHASKPPGVDIEAEFDPGVGSINGNHGKLERALVNMVVNAFEAIGSKGTVTISSYMRKNAIIIGIRDTGCGIAPEFFQEIFKAQFTTKIDGTGLGLTNARKTVESHGGQITLVQSAIGNGTLFEISLPAKKE